MTIPSRLSSYLEQRGVHYEVCAHQRSRTSAQTARTINVAPHELAKSVIVEDDAGCVMAVPESAVADILWHSNPSMTRHYSMAQIVELHAALEKIKEDTGRWNKSLATLRREHEEAVRGTLGEESPPKVPQQRKTA